jgi:hypothetical protein
LAEEELEDVAKFVVGIRGVRGEQSEDIGETTSGMGFYSSIFVKEDSVVRQLLADSREGSRVDAVLVELCELSVEILQLL